MCEKRESPGNPKNNLSNRVSPTVPNRTSYFLTFDAETNFLRSKPE